MGQSLCKKGREQSRGRSRAIKMHSHDALASPRAAMALIGSCQAGQLGQGHWALHPPGAPERGLTLV